MKNYQSSIWCRDSNSKHVGHLSSPITTRQGLLLKTECICTIKFASLRLFNTSANLCYALFVCEFFFKCPIPDLFFVYFRSFQTKYYKFYNKSMWKNPTSVCCWDLNSRPSDYESPPITTRLRLPPSVCKLVKCSKPCRKLRPRLSRQKRFVGLTRGAVGLLSRIPVGIEHFQWMVARSNDAF